MKSKRGPDLSSLDLLLDTMCNAFGGIVFIALLLAILSRAIGHTDQERPGALAEPKRLLEVQCRELDQLNAQAEALWEALKLQLSISITDHSTVLAHLQKYSRFQAKNAVFQKEIKTWEKRLGEAEEEGALAKAALEGTTRTRKVLKAEIAQLSESIQGLMAETKRPLRLPCLHRVNKDSVLFAVRNKRFYAIHDISGKSPATRNLDHEDVQVDRDRSGFLTVAPYPHTGQVISKGAEKRGKLETALANLDPHREFADFAVYKDSFAEFNYVKSLFVQAGFEYNWTIHEGPIKIVGASEVTAQ